RKPFGGYKLPDNIFTSASVASEGELEELRRLFYVALTRAEQYLYISYSCFKNDGKEIEPSMFIAEIREQHVLSVEKVFIDPVVLTEFQLLNLQAEQAPEIEKIEAEFIGALIERFVMNVT